MNHRRQVTLQIYQPIAEIYNFVSRVSLAQGVGRRETLNKVERSIVTGSACRYNMST